MAYAAGIVDGEGCIRSYKSRSAYVVVHISVTNTDYAMITWFQESFGGFISEHTKDHAKWKDSWRWHVSADLARQFLEQVYPYLRTKKAQADTALAIMDTVGNRGPVTDETKQLRLDLHATLQEQKRA